MSSIGFLISILIPIVLVISGFTEYEDFTRGIAGKAVIVLLIAKAIVLIILIIFSFGLMQQFQTK